jgi:CelD/BcsL family acetyltransferase involved in cellulose biosynthesis
MVMLGNYKSPAIIDPANDSRWDAFVEAHPLGWLCHLSGWKKVLESAFSHMKGYYIVLWAPSGERIQAGLPIFHVRSWILGDRFIAAPFATLFDPLVSSPEQFNLLLGTIRGLSAALRTKFIEIRTLSAGMMLEGSGLAESRCYKHHFLNLEPGPQILMKQFHRTCVRQRINRARSSDLKLRVGHGESDLKEFYRLFTITRRRVGRPLQPYQFIKTLWEVFSPTGRLELLLAVKEGTVVSGLMLFKFKNRVSAEFAASDERFKELSPNHFLFWEAIQRACCQGYSLFDFGRTSPDNRNLMEFKRRWGAQVIDLPQFYSPVELTDAIGHGNPGWRVRLVETIVSRSPVCAQQLIGSAIYQHMG